MTRKRALLGSVVFLLALGMALFVLPDLKAGADPGLVPFGTCDEFLSYMKSALRDSHIGVAVAGSEMVTADAAEEPVARDEGDSSAADGSRATAGESLGHSATNVQERGIDEGDIVETDGRHLFVLSGAELHSIAVSAGTPQLVDTLTFEDAFGFGGEGQLLLDDDTLVVVRQTHDAVDGRAWVRVLAVDIDTSGRMTPVGESRVEGTLVSARGTNGSVTVVTSHRPELPAPVVPDGPDTPFDHEEWLRRTIDGLSVEDLLPKVTTTVGGETATHDLVACEQVHRPQDPSGPTLLNVVTIGRESAEPVDAETVVADGQILYASEAAVYVATGSWPGGVAPMAAEGDAGGSGLETVVHRFDRTEDGVTYYGSGSVRGHLLNQFALSEHEGHLRVASTNESRGASPDGVEFLPASESLVTVLEPRDGRLVPVGEVSGLGPTERIYSVRFMGDRAYVVTFRQTDPLYTLDLSDPAAPRETGELEIMGFSAYLHPLSDGRLLGVGQDATESGQQLGTQVSLFDVADPASPRRLAQWAAGEWSRSEAEYDHHAFLFWAPRNLALLPLQDAVVGLEVGDGTFAQVGAIQHPATDECPQPSGEVQSSPVGGGVSSSVVEDVVGAEPVCHGSGMSIRRSVVVGDNVYTVGDSGVMATDLDTFRTVGWLGF